jgi:hypothetical protein
MIAALKNSLNPKVQCIRGIGCKNDPAAVFDSEQFSQFISCLINLFACPDRHAMPRPPRISAVITHAFIHCPEHPFRFWVACGSIIQIYHIAPPTALEGDLITSDSYYAEAIHSASILRLKQYEWFQPCFPRLCASVLDHHILRFYFFSAQHEVSDENFLFPKIKLSIIKK